MSFRFRAVSAAMLLAAFAPSALPAQVCPSEDQVSGLIIRPAGFEGDYGNIRVTLPDGESLLAFPAADRSGWQLDLLEAPFCFQDITFSLAVPGYSMVNVDNTRRESRDDRSFAIYEITVEKTWTLLVTADGEKGPVDVIVNKESTDQETGSVIRDTTNYSGEFPISDAVALKVYAQGTFFYDVIVDDLDADNDGLERHDKRVIMDGICSSMGPPKRFCACQKVWKFLTCMAQKREISTEAITYSQNPPSRQR